MVKNPPERVGDTGDFKFNPWTRKIPLEEDMATHFNILAWRIPWTKKPGRLQSMSRKESDTT